MGDTAKITEPKMREALAAIVSAQEAAFAEWKEFEEKVPKRMSPAQRERSAYLRGRLAGLHQAHREFEMRSPIEFHGS